MEESLRENQQGELGSNKPISNRSPPVVVEYDCRGKRATKHFTDSYQARSFYVMKDRQGKHPKVLKEN